MEERRSNSLRAIEAVINRASGCLDEADDRHLRSRELANSAHGMVVAARRELAELYEALEEVLDGRL